MENTDKKAMAFLETLVNQVLRYGLKSPDMDLYDFGFGDSSGIKKEYRKIREICTHFLHVTCRFKVIWRNGDKRIDIFYEDTPCEEFHQAVKQLIGMRVKRVALSDKNDLWLDFGDCWVVFATFENGEESWRLFSSNREIHHLVASDSWVDFSV